MDIGLSSVHVEDPYYVNLAASMIVDHVITRLQVFVDEHLRVTIPFFDVECLGPEP